MIATIQAALASTPGIIVVVLLFVLLLQKELLRAAGGPRARRWMNAANIAIAPLLLTFGFIIITRLLNLLAPS